MKSLENGDNTRAFQVMKDVVLCSLSNTTRVDPATEKRSLFFFFHVV